MSVFRYGCACYRTEFMMGPLLLLVLIWLLFQQLGHEVILALGDRLRRPRRA